MNTEKDEYEQLLKESFHAAIDAVDARKVIPPHIPKTFEGDVVVVGAGKAAASMAAAVEEAWPEKDLSGVVITRKGYKEPTKKIIVLEASHPIPDKTNLEASRKLMKELDKLHEGSLLLALISGGGSNLLSLPVKDVSIEDVRKVTEDLLEAGVPIDHIDAVCKHVSEIKGGRLALAARAKQAEVLALIISDAVGDNPSKIASGPCAEDFSTYADALWYLSQSKIEAPKSILKHLRQGAKGEVGETPKIGDSRMRGVKNKIVANSFKGLQAAAIFFKEKGMRPVIIGDDISGEARSVAQQVARKVRLELSKPRRKPVVLLSGGECHIKANGRRPTKSGLCSEFLLALVHELDGEPIYAMAADTDGADKEGETSGAIFKPDSIQRANELGLSVDEYLEEHKAEEFFAKLGDLLDMGRTKTNINHYRAILIP